jgi:hypothetical protein
VTCSSVLVNHIVLNAQGALTAKKYRYVVNVTSEFERMFEVIWSSDQVHVVDALAATGDEGRSSLR